MLETNFTSNTGRYGKDLFLRLFSNPFKRFEDMDMMHHSRTLGLVEMDKSVWKRLTGAEKEEICRIFDDALLRYYNRFCKAQ